MFKPARYTLAGIYFSYFKKVFVQNGIKIHVPLELTELEFLRNYKEGLKCIEHVFMEIHPFAGILTLKEAEECEQILNSLMFTRILQDGNYQIWQKENLKYTA